MTFLKPLSRLLGADRRLRDRLLRSHLKVGLLGVALLAVALGSTLWLRAHTLRLARLRGPLVQQSMLALNGLQGSLAALRGWIVLGDSAFRVDRQAAWKETVWPAIDSLETLFRRHPDATSPRRLRELDSLLVDLHESQWWIEDVAAAPCNEPARVIHSHNVRPIAEMVDRGTTGLIELERGTSAAAPYGLRDLLQEFRFGFVSSRKHLNGYLEGGSRAEHSGFREAVERADARLRAIEARRHEVSPRGREILAWLGDEYAAYRRYAEQAMAARVGPGGTLAETWLARDARPAARRATELLSSLSSSQRAEMQADADRVVLVSNLVVVISLLLIGGMAVLAYVLSRRGAARLTRPIEALARAADELAAGQRIEDVPVRGDDEPARLTEAFNSMRASLSERTAELEAFSYSVSHDLRRPVQTIDAFSRILSEDHGDGLDADGRRVLGVIREQAEEMEEMIERLLAVSRLGRTELERVVIDMEELVRKLVRELAVEFPRRRFRFEVGRLASVEGDPRLVQEVWVNLLSNAVKFSRDRDMAIIEVRSELRDGEYVYYVRDNGVGFDPRYADRLFGVFERLHVADEFEGTGAGLAIVERIVRRHGGRVWAEGAVDGGATFYFTLPRPEDRRGGDPPGPVPAGRFAGSPGRPTDPDTNAEDHWREDE